MLIFPIQNAFSRIVTKTRKKFSRFAVKRCNFISVQLVHTLIASSFFFWPNEHPTRLLPRVKVQQEVVGEKEQRRILTENFVFYCCCNLAFHPGGTCLVCMGCMWHSCSPSLGHMVRFMLWRQSLRPRRGRSCFSGADQNRLNSRPWLAVVRGGGVARGPKSAQKLARSGGLTPSSPECLGRAECAPAVQPPEPPLPSRIPPGLDPMGVASHGEPGAVPTRALLQLRHRAVCCCWVVIGFLCGFIVGPKFIFIKRRTVSF